MNHDFADVKSVMSETGKVHLGTGVAEGEGRVIEATEKAISNPLLENNSMSGAKGVLINITCGDDTTLQDIDLANNKIREEADENANIISGLQKDDSYNGKFKISVISTGIDSDNYYSNLINEETDNNLMNSQNIDHDINQEIEEKIVNQPSFLVDLRQPSKSQENVNLANEEKILNEQHPERGLSEKKSLFGFIFGNKTVKTGVDNKKILNDEEHSKKQFINEIQEISDEDSDNITYGNEKIVIEDESVRFLNTNDQDDNPTFNQEEKECNNSENDVNDDLLQIPAFLRRQAN